LGGVHLHSLFQILHDFCLHCYLALDNPPTLAPQSILFRKPHYELNTPFLKDVSKSSLSDETWGEAAVERHDTSPDLVRSDREESVSDASQYVADGCAARYHFLCSLKSPSPQGSTISESINASSSSQPAFTPPPQNSDASSSPLIVAPRAQVPLTTRQFTCPDCPRTFAGHAKLSFWLSMELQPTERSPKASGST